MPDGASRPAFESPWTPASTQPPTLAELAIERNRALFALSAKYPLRPHAVLSAEQLAATRAQLGPAGFVVRKGPGRRDEDRRALTAEELKAARSAAYGS